MDDAIEAGREPEALALYDEMRIALDIADSDGVIDVARADQLRARLQQTYDGVVYARQIAEIRKRIEQAFSQGRKEEERTARQELQELQPSEENQERIDLLSAEILFAEAEKLIAGGRIEDAREKLVAILRDIDADYTPASEALVRLDQETDYQNRLIQANRAYDGQRWDEARRLYERLLLERDDATVRRRLVECRFNERLQTLDAQRDAAVATGDIQALKALVVEYKALVEIDAERMAVDVAPRVTELQRIVSRAEAIARGDSLLTEGKWIEAVEAYQQALRDSVTTDETDEVEELIVEAEYERYLSIGKEALAEARYRAAKANFLRAQQRRNTEEIRDLLNTVETFLAEQES
jgi:tetratricopeptide (TPR) repeat protein